MLFVALDWMVDWIVSSMFIVWSISSGSWRLEVDWLREQEDVEKRDDGGEVEIIVEVIFLPTSFIITEF